MTSSNALVGHQTRISQLTQPLREVIELVTRGATNNEIADTLDLNLLTVKSRLQRAFEQLGVSTRFEAVAICAQTCTDEDMERAIQLLSGLSVSQRKIARLVADDLPNHTIAQQLFLTNRDFASKFKDMLEFLGMPKLGIAYLYRCSVRDRSDVVLIREPDAQIVPTNKPASPFDKFKPYIGTFPDPQALADFSPADLELLRLVIERDGQAGASNHLLDQDIVALTVSMNHRILTMRRAADATSTTVLSAMYGCYTPKDQEKSRRLLSALEQPEIDYCIGLSLGLTIAEIAKLIGVKRSTLENSSRVIYRKLKVPGRNAAARLVGQTGALKRFIAHE